MKKTYKIMCYFCLTCLLGTALMGLVDAICSSPMPVKFSGDTIMFFGGTLYFGIIAFCCKLADTITVVRAERAHERTMRLVVK